MFPAYIQQPFLLRYAFKKLDLANPRKYMAFEQCNRKETLLYFSAVKSLPRVEDFAPRNGKFFDPWNRNLSSIAALQMPTAQDLAKQKLKYNDVCDKVAIDIIDQTNCSDRQVILSYSGGVDSTNVLVALLKNGIDLKKFTLLMSKDSIDENPLFYKDVIYDRINCKNVHEFVKEKNNPTRYWHLTGEFGGQLFAMQASVDFHRKNNMPFQSEYAKHKNEVGQFIFKDPDVREWFMHEMDGNIATAPCKIETTGDFFWWIGFNFKWQEIYYRRGASILDFYGLFEHEDDQATKKYLDSEIEFFGQKEFQIWSMQNGGDSTEKWDSDITSFKLAAKKYIYDFYPDDDYLKNKGKVLSQPLIADHNLYINQTMPFVVDMDYKCYYIKKDTAVADKLFNQTVLLPKLFKR